MALDDTDRRRIAPYVSTETGDVFALHGLPEEVIAVLFAYYSRSKDDLRSNLAKLLRDDELAVGGEGPRATVAMAAEKAKSFHEKWVVGYGHGSVAEHAVVHLAIENASIVASKVIEDLRLGSYTEKSTRYVVFDNTSFVDLPELPAPLRDVYRSANEASFRVYLGLFPATEAALKQRVPRGEKQTEKGWENAIRAQACDVLRGLLPAGTKTNLGLTANARALEGLLSKMMSHPVAEVRRVADAMRKEALVVAPTLVKYARENAYRRSLREEVAPSIPPPATEPPSATDAAVRLVLYDRDALERTDGPRLSQLVRGALAKRGPWDPPPRAFEAASLTVELTMDYGAYRDLQRHRMLTPHTQLLGCELGAPVPREVVELGIEGPYRAAQEQAERAWHELRAHDPWLAQYVVPLGYRCRTLWTLNVRELFHVVELRSARQGHPSYRRVAQELHAVAMRVFPWLEGLVRVDNEAYALARDPAKS